MEITSRIDGSKISINIEPDKTYGILISGGLDSAMMLHLMLLDAQQKNFTPKIVPYCINKNDGSTNFVKPILDYFSKRFNTTFPEPKYYGDPNTPHAIMSRLAITEMKKSGENFDYLYIGINQNPPDIDCDSIWGPGNYPNRTKSSEVDWIVLPFVHLYKHHVLDLMFEHNLEEIFNISHSCTDRNVGRCNKCFQCTERMWAFRKLGRIDTGTN